MQDFRVHSSNAIFFLSTSLTVSREDIKSFISLVLAIVVPNAVFWKFWSRTNLSQASTMGIYVALEVVVVYKYKHFMLASFRVMAPSCECFNNDQKLYFMSFVVITVARAPAYETFTVARNRTYPNSTSATKFRNTACRFNVSNIIPNHLNISPYTS